MNKLEFNIVDNQRLDVLDFSWYISEINAIYISRSKWDSKINPNYAIYILSNSDLVELYYKTNDEIKISNCFKDLCSAIKEINPNFEMCFPYCVNMEQVKDIDYSKGIVLGEFKINFESDEIEFRTSKKYAKQFIEKIEEKEVFFEQ